MLAGLPAVAVDRNAFSIPYCDMRVIVDPDQHRLSVEATLDLRNVSSRPQSTAALQLSSSLRWRAISAEGAPPVEWRVQEYNSDVDHSGQLREALVTLTPPLEPGKSRRFRVRYSGTIRLDTTRLESIGVPPEIARRNDWDRISPGFTALRGAGHVVWYPVSMEAASLRNRNELFETMHEWHQRQKWSMLRFSVRRAHAVAGASDQTRSNEEAEADEDAAPTRFVANGSGETSGTTLRQEFYGVDPVLVFFGETSHHAADANVEAFYSAGHRAAAHELMTAAEDVMQPLQAWFGAPRNKVVIVELTDPDALPHESGSWYFTPLRTLDSPDARDGAQLAMTRSVAKASFDSPRPWIREGLASFAQALIRERQAGRAAALSLLSQFNPVLARADADFRTAAANVSPQPAGETLIRSADELILRAKGAYVWWMLRDQLGDAALQSALAFYHGWADRYDAYMQNLLESQSTPRRDLSEFFDDWVYRDRGLPRLRLLSAYTSISLRSQTVTVVAVENLGEIGCEVPVVLRSSSTEARKLIFIPAKGIREVRIPMDGVPVEAAINDGSVPEAGRDGHKIAVTLTLPPSE